MTRKLLLGTIALTLMLISPQVALPRPVGVPAPYAKLKASPSLAREIRLAPHKSTALAKHETEIACYSSKAGNRSKRALMEVRTHSGMVFLHRETKKPFATWHHATRTLYALEPITCLTFES